MGICNTKIINYINIDNLDIGTYIIQLYKNSKEYDYLTNLNRSIFIYEDQKKDNINIDIDYCTKCIIVASFIRDIDKLLIKKKNKKYNNHICKILLNLKIPIFIIEILEAYRNKENNNKYLNLMIIHDNYIIDNNSKTIDQKLNIISGLINNILNI